MFHFLRKKESAPTAPTPPSALELALREVEAANARLETIGQEWRKLQDEFHVTINPDGQIVSAIIPQKYGADSAALMRTELDALIRKNWHARSLALGEFHRALAVWSGLKNGNGGTQWQ